MDLNLKEIKTEARRSMRLTSPDYRLVAACYLLLTTGVSLLFTLIAPSGEGTFALFLSFAVSLYTVIVEFGYLLWSLWTHRRLNPGMDALIQGFSVTGRVIYLQISIFIRLFIRLFCLLFAVSLIAILVTNNPLVAAIITVPASYISMYALSLRYKFAPYLLADFPDLGPSVALQRSVQLSYGWKMQWFKLDLSFIGWLILDGVLKAMAFLLCAGSGIDLAALTTADSQLILNNMMNMMSLSSSLPVLLGTALICLPLQLWLQPYRQVCFASLYDMRLQLAAQGGTADHFGPICPPV